MKSTVTQPTTTEQTPRVIEVGRTQWRDQNRTVDVLIAEARTWDTARLEATRAEGLHLAATGGITAYWLEVMHAVQAVLTERAAAEAEATP